MTQNLQDRFLTLSEAGFWEIRPPGADDVRPVAIAVNVERAEAELDPLDPEEFSATLSAGAAGELPGSEAARATELRQADQEQRQSWWRLLLLAAFLILAIETVVSNRLSGRSTRRKQHARATS